MATRIIAQPNDPFRIGDFLLAGLLDPRWTHFRGAVAFVKRSGTEHLRAALTDFSSRADATLSVGLDHGGTSVEGISDLFNALEPRGKLWVYKNNANTFHPKAYLFKNATEAELLVGSGNMTEGGLYENAELALRTTLNLSLPADIALLGELERAFDEWSTAQPKRCLAVDAKLIADLHASGDLPTEAEAARATRAAAATRISVSGRKPSLFDSKRVQPAPLRTVPTTGPQGMPSGPTMARPPTTIPSPLSGPASLAVPAAAPPTAHGLTFVMTLQNTDVGVGMTGTSTNARSPEIFIPVGALDRQPQFWGWLTNITPDNSKYKVDHAWRIAHAGKIAQRQAKVRRINRPVDKLDWYGVRVNLQGHAGLLDVNIWFNPDKIDIRLRNATLRAAGQVNDLLVIKAASLGAGHTYDMEVVKTSDPRYSALLHRCTETVPNSPKRYGYF